jgi:precorrin-2 dehydrogenase/sirohydrochlorin ferrochelatase
MRSPLGPSISEQWNEIALPRKLIKVMSAAYPLLLDVTGRMIVIIGGGAVAARKARGLLEAGAGRIRCVAPEFCTELPTQIERVEQTYRPEHLDGAALVFAATDSPEINQAVVRDARTRNLLVNRADADEEEPGDFTAPAPLRRGMVTIAVSAGSPALAALIRDRLNGLFDPRWQQMADAMRQLRPLVKSAGLDIAARRRIFQELASEEALDAAAGGSQAVREWLLGRHPELRHA